MEWNSIICRTNHPGFFGLKGGGDPDILLMIARISAADYVGPARHRTSTFSTPLFPGLI